MGSRASSRCVPLASGWPCRAGFSSRSTFVKLLSDYVHSEMQHRRLSKISNESQSVVLLKQCVAQNLFDIMMTHCGSFQCQLSEIADIQFCQTTPLAASFAAAHAATEGVNAQRSVYSSLLPRVRSVSEHGSHLLIRCGDVWRNACIIPHAGRCCLQSAGRVPERDAGLLFPVPRHCTVRLC